MRTSPTCTQRPSLNTTAGRPVIYERKMEERTERGNLQTHVLWLYRDLGTGMVRSIKSRWQPREPWRHVEILRFRLVPTTSRLVDADCVVRDIRIHSYPRSQSFYWINRTIFDSFTFVADIAGIPPHTSPGSPAAARPGLVKNQRYKRWALSSLVL